MPWKWSRSRRDAIRPGVTRRIAPAIESLEGRSLLSTWTYQPSAGPSGSLGGSGPSMIGTAPHVRAGHGATGTVHKAPRFYPFYTGPHRTELNAVAATGTLLADGSFRFSGTNQGRITSAPAVYVFGVDRSGSLPSGPFTGRPGIRFDAVVVVSLDQALHPTALVKDLASQKTTVLPEGSAFIQGRKVEVTVPASLLPSTGLAPSQYRFNYWPEDGGPPNSASVASFAPEFTTVQVGTARTR